MIDAGRSWLRSKQRAVTPPPLPARALEQVLAAKTASAEATLVYDAARARSTLPISPYLVVITGPRKGMEIPLGFGVTTIGRGEENTAVIPDISVSREHVSLAREQERVVLYDQGSGNGTWVNGQRIARHSLRHFDELTMGDTKVRFVEPGAAPLAPAAETWRPHRLAIALAAVVVAAGGGLLARRVRQQRAQLSARVQREQTKALAQQWFEEGSALSKEGRWPEALGKLKIAAELDGQDVEILRAIEEAEAEIARGKPAAAEGLVSGVAADRATQAKPEAARPEAPKPAVPRHAKPLQTKPADVQTKLLDVQTMPANVQTKLAAVEEEQPPDVQKVLAPYLAGDLVAALEQAARSLGPRGPPLLAQLRTFEAARREGLAFAQEQQLSEALQALTKAQAEDRAIAQGKSSHFARELRKALAVLHIRLAEQSAASDDGLPAAAGHLRGALREDPANELAAKELRGLGERCQELYLRGYVSKDDDVATARSAFKLVLATLPPGDATAQKARKWLEKLDSKNEDRSIGGG
jgi:pSer/pThr/pTyr-binding forkhead associated (FHA) protein